MRTLEFTVRKQRLLRKPTCDFSGLVAGSQGYLYAKFDFSPEWDGCQLGARFIVRDTSGEREYGALLDKNHVCIIPSEALVGDMFYVSVKGVKDGGKYQIESSEIAVKQEVR